MTKKQETQIWYAYDIAKMTKNIVHSNDYNSVHDIDTVKINNYWFFPHPRVIPSYFSMT